MAEAGSFADRVKQQADIVRVVGEYVRLKKSGQNYVGLCPFHSEKTPSFAVHPVKQIYHCFGCGVGGDVFKFVMEMEKSNFPEAVRTVAEKCGIPIPKPRERTPEERQANQQRTALVEMHREAAAFFTRQLEATPEGKAARAYLEDRGLDAETIARFNLGYAPSGGDALYRHLKQKYPDKLLEVSGLVARDPSGRLYDRFRRRIMFPIANESGKVIAFGGRALGDDLPKYLNSPETAIYTKSRVLYNLNRVREALLEKHVKYEGRYVVLVEGYMDCIRVHSKFPYVVASCGTSLTELHVGLLRRFTPRVVVWYDADSAGKAATERSLDILLNEGLEVEVYDYKSSSGDPDTFVREKGADALRKPIIDPFERLAQVLIARDAEEAGRKQLAEFQTPFYEEQLKKEGELRKEIQEIKGRIPRAEKGGLLSYQDFLMERAKGLFNLSTGEGKLRAVNYLMPYVQRIPNRLLRSEWATRIAQQLRVEEPVLREALRRAAAERRGEVKAKPELVARAMKPAERRLVQLLMEAEGFRAKLATELRGGELGALYQGLESEKIFAVLTEACERGEHPDPAALASALEEKDRRLLFDILFESAAAPTWDEAESCLDVLRLRRLQGELAAIQKQIESKPAAGELRQLLGRRDELHKRLSAIKA